MTDPEPNLDDVMTPIEHERVQAGVHDYDPDAVPPATE